MSRFSYVRAHDMDEALALLNESGLRSRVLAGGTDLVNQLRKGEADCDRVVDVAHVPQLGVIKADGKIVIGAAVTHSEIAESPILQQRVPFLVQACQKIGSPQIRNIATIGGNVVNAAACADTLPVLVCLDAEAVIVTPAGELRMPVTELVSGVYQTRLPRGALVRAFVFDPPPVPDRTVFLRIGRRRAMSIARLSLAAMGQLDAAGRIALIRLAPGAAFARFRRATEVEEMVVGREPSPQLFNEAGIQMTGLFLAESGGRWSAPYKERAIAALTERALKEVLTV